MTSSRLLPPRFFMLDSVTLQTGLEERIRDVVHSSVSPLVAAPWMEEFRSLVELAVSSSCFLLGLLASRSEQLTGYSVAYGDSVYNLRYVKHDGATAAAESAMAAAAAAAAGQHQPRTAAAAGSAISAFASSRGYRPAALRSSGLLTRMLLRFLLLQVLPVLSRLIQRRFAELLNNNNNNNGDHFGVDDDENQQQQQHLPQHHAARTLLPLLAVGIKNLEKILRALDLLNHIHFLYDGTYRNFVDRLLGVRLASGDRELQLSAHTYLIDRQHYWATVFAALSLFVPMLNIGGWISFVGRHVKRFVFQVSSVAGGGSSSSSAGGAESASSSASSRSNQQLQQLRQQQMNFECLVCHTEPMAMPQKAKECGHVCVCYYCAASHKPDACPLCHAYASSFVDP